MLINMNLHQVSNFHRKS